MNTETTIPLSQRKYSKLHECRLLQYTKPAELIIRIEVFKKPGIPISPNRFKVVTKVNLFVTAQMTNMNNKYLTETANIDHPLAYKSTREWSREDYTRSAICTGVTGDEWVLL